MNDGGPSLDGADTADVILVDIFDDGVARVTLNRPRVRNALDNALLTRLHETLTTLGADDHVGAIVLTGAGSAFCSGADLLEARGEAVAGDTERRRIRARTTMQLHALVPHLPIPVIAAVNGPAMGGGCGLAIACDLVYAGESAMFGFPEVILGRVPAIVAVNLVRTVGRRTALELLLGAETIDAGTAVQRGMINGVIPDRRLLPDCQALATSLASRSRHVVTEIKALVGRVPHMPDHVGLAYASVINQALNE